MILTKFISKISWISFINWWGNHKQKEQFWKQNQRNWENQIREKLEKKDEPVYPNSWVDFIQTSLVNSLIETIDNTLKDEE